MLLTDEVSYPRVYVNRSLLPDIRWQHAQTLPRQLEQAGFLAVSPEHPVFCWWRQHIAFAIGPESNFRHSKDYVAIPYPYLSDAELQQLHDAFEDTYVTH